MSAPSIPFGLRHLAQQTFGADLDHVRVVSKFVSFVDPTSGATLADELDQPTLRWLSNCLRSSLYRQPSETEAKWPGLVSLRATHRRNASYGTPTLDFGRRSRAGARAR